MGTELWDLFLLILWTKMQALCNIYSGDMKYLRYYRSWGGRCSISMLTDSEFVILVACYCSSGLGYWFRPSLSSSMALMMRNRRRRQLSEPWECSALLSCCLSTEFTTMPIIRPTASRKHPKDTHCKGAQLPITELADMTKGFVSRGNLTL